MDGKPKRRSIPASTKLQALSFLKSSKNVSQTARRFQVSRQQVREWRKNENALKCIGNSRKRLDGAGRKLSSNDLEIHLVDWINVKRADRLRVSRSMIQREAERFMKDKQPETIFSASSGWLQKFLRRNRISRFNRFADSLLVDDSWFGTRSKVIRRKRPRTTYDRCALILVSYLEDVLDSYSRQTSAGTEA